MKDCFNLEGDVTGEWPFLPGDVSGGVDGLPVIVLEELVEDDGLRKGDVRGLLGESGDGLYVDV